MTPSWRAALISRCSAVLGRCCHFSARSRHLTARFSSADSAAVAVVPFFRRAAAAAAAIAPDGFGMTRIAAGRLFATGRLLAVVVVAVGRRTDCVFTGCTSFGSWRRGDDASTWARSECAVNGDEYGDDSDVSATREVAPLPPPEGAAGAVIVGSACDSSSRPSSGLRPQSAALLVAAASSAVVHCAESELAASGELGELLNVVWSASAIGADLMSSHFDSSFVYSCSPSRTAVIARRLSERRRLSSGGSALTQFRRAHGGGGGARGSSLSSENEFGCTAAAFGMPPHMRSPTSSFERLRISMKILP